MSFAPVAGPILPGFSGMAARIATIEARFAARTAAVAGGGPAGILGADTLPTAGTAGAFATDLARAASDLQGAATAPATGDAVVGLARKYLGVPYVWGGTDPATGLDCSALVQLVYAQVGVDLPRVSRDQARAGTPVDGLANARPGDLLAFDRPVDHIGIYLGDGRMIHAPRTGKDVEVSPVYETPTAIRRVLADPASPSLRVGRHDAASVGAGVLPAGTPYAAEFERAAATSGLPARVLAAVARAESNFRPDAVSPAGARGLMQLMPGTAAGLGVNPLDPAAAVGGAARLLADHLREFGTLPLALAAYNAGPGNVRRYGGIPPFAETQAYVQKIMTELTGRAA